MEQHQKQSPRIKYGTFSVNLITSTGRVTVPTEEQKQGTGKLLVKIPKSKLETALWIPKKILTFYHHGAAPKKANTEGVMHEYHVKDHPSYKA